MNHFDILRPVRGTAIPLVVHVPHASVVIPPAYRGDFALDDAALATELLAMTDRYTDELAAVATALGGTVFVNRVSRLVMDPERFADDAEEPMAAKGMGAIYVSRHDGSPLRRADFGADERSARMTALYAPYHEAFDRLVTEQLTRFERCLIVDLHSFPRVALPYEDASLPRPPVCIGFDAFHVDTELRDIWAELTNGHGFEIGLNTPFAGSLVPLRFYEADRRVRSLMIELRRDLYTIESTGAKAPTFGDVQLLVRALLTAAADQAAMAINLAE